VAGKTSLGDDDGLVSGINITPLVDVVLVLLVIFLMTAPVIYQSAIKVQLPKARTGEAAEKTPLSFTLSRQGELSWGADRIDWTILGQRLAALGDRAADETAVISADEGTPHGLVVRLMDALRQAGLTKFALNVESGTLSGK
jgi:biopolymer transport protein ExbD